MIDMAKRSLLGGSSSIRKSINDAWKSGDEDRLLEALSGLENHKLPHIDLVAKLGEICMETEAFSIRNAAAIALADIHSKDADVIIIGVLKRPDIHRSSGTLLY